MGISSQSRMNKWIVLAVMMAVGWGTDGSYKGAVAWAIVFAGVWFLWEVAHHEPGQQKPSYQRTEDFRETVDSPAIRGKRNPDPTRPDEEMAGLITNYVERKRGI